jgi:hypothetical protein
VTRCAALALLALAITGASDAKAQEEAANAEEPSAPRDAGARQLLELSVGGGLSWISPDPEHMDLGLGGQLNVRAAVDVVHARFDATATLPDPSRPELWWLRTDGRLLFIAVHDLTWRRTPDTELVRLYGGVGGDIDFPDNVAHLMLGAGAAILRLSRTGRELSEAYGAYAGATLRVHFWEIRNELRVVVHAITAPPTLSLGFSMDQVFANLRVGTMIENRLYLQALREDVISLGPEIVFSFEDMLEGSVIVMTLGISGQLGV